MGDFAKEIQSSFPNEKVKAMLNIKYTSNYLNNIAEKYFTKHGISPQQYNVLRILRGAGKAINVKSVKDRMIEKSPNSTRLMDKLCSKNLICRARSEDDRRAVYVEITEIGLTLLKEIDEEDGLMDCVALTEKEAKELNRMLDLIRS